MESLPTWIALAAGGNLVVLLVGLFWLAKRVRKLFQEHISDPIAQLQSTVEGLAANDIALTTEARQTRELAQRAHDRIDELILKGHSNG